MKKFNFIIICVLLFFCIILPANAKLNIISNSSTVESVASTTNTISLDQAKNESSNYENSSENSNVTNLTSTSDSTSSSYISSGNILTSIVSDGIGLFAKSTFDDMYASFDNNTEINTKFGPVRGALFTAITFVPNPYDDPEIKKMYLNYNNLAIYFVILFIFGAWTNRNLARMHITSSVFGKKDLSSSTFFGGICMCGLALCANLFYMFGLQIIQALSQYFMGSTLDSIAPTSDHLILYCMMGICDIIVFIFFLIRYFVIYAIAVICSLLAVLLVPEFSRDFAKKSIDKIIRILIMQPVAIMFASICIIALNHLSAGMQQLGYVALIILIFRLCWYIMFGDFEFVKKGISLAVTKGLV